MDWLSELATHPGMPATSNKGNGGIGRGDLERLANGGNLFFDADGSGLGRAVWLANIIGSGFLSAADIVIIA